MIGDLNATPWSHGYRKLLRESDLYDSLVGSGRQASWPSGMGLAGKLGMIPIDHCLVSLGVEVLDRDLGQASGSDHRPLVVGLRVAP